jgi:hypothetical protein
MTDLEEFVRGLHSSNREDRIYSINAITYLGPGAVASAIPELVALLDDSDETIARLSLRGLSFLEPPNILSLKPRIVSLLRDPRSGIRQAAAFALGTMQASAADTVPFLVAMLNDQETGVQMHVMTALGRVTVDLERTVELLQQALEHEDEQIRDGAEQALRRAYADARSTDTTPRPADPPPVRPLKRRTVRSLDEQESRALADSAAHGHALLPAGLALQEPEDVVSAIAAAIEDVRAGKRRITDDEAADVGALFGEQIRRVTDWSWVAFSADGLDRSLLGLVNSDRSFVCLPSQTVYDNLANKPRANTIPALFHIMAEGLLPREDADSLELIR